MFKPLSPASGARVLSFKKSASPALEATYWTGRSWLQIFPSMLCPGMLGFRIHSTNGTPHLSAYFPPILPMGAQEGNRRQEEGLTFLVLLPVAADVSWTPPVSLAEAAGPILQFLLLELPEPVPPNPSSRGTSDGSRSLLRGLSPTPQVFVLTS